MNPLGYGDPLRLGPYRVLGVLGEGGMGKVYLGRDSSGRKAAVKVLLPELAHDAQTSQRFLREAQAAQAVRGKGVARVLAVETEGGRPYIATEFLAGPTLDSLVRHHGALQEPYVRALGATLARTLGDIHAAGLVHRDLKPSNIVLTSTGPRVIDFGIARPEHGMTLTTTGQTPATPGYGAPEQILGQRTGPAGDLFALGAVLVYAATGAPAYDAGHVAAVQYEVVHGQPRLDALPPALRILIEPCLAKDPALRPLPAQIISALDPPRGAAKLWKQGPVAVEIGRSEEEARRLATFPDADTLVGSTAPGTGAPSRRRFFTGLAAGGTVLAAAGVGGLWWMTGDETPPRAHPWDADRLTDYEQGKAPDPLWGPQKTPVTGGVDLLVVRDLIILDTRSPDLIAYSVTDGKLKWRAKDVGWPALYSPSVDLLLAKSVDELYGVARKTGERLWSSPVGIVTVLALAGDVYYYHDISGDYRVPGEVVALRVTRSGSKELWRKPIPFGADVDDLEAAAAGDRLVLTARERGAVALDAANGEEVWKVSRKSGETWLPYVAGDTVYLGGPSLRAFRLSDGKPGWSEAASTNSGLSVGAVDGDHLYLVAGGQLRCHRRKDGSKKWARVLQNPIQGRPVVSGDTVWVSSSLGTEGVKAFRKSDGEPLWTLQKGQEAEGSAKIAGAGNRVFSFRDGKLTALPVI
ncbi:serine/threonine-protein kinase [Streptomyces sp. N2-109]|uniref:Serine/threonine-protein kinase n=1 Tax=Streptomyces gossypii TaxID=2883101 RepID=A0ABT2JST6_9ACTN|nr:serine/threonine-protein kinase [Streptomyces gossypii]MCT2590954.1 serine/threonine-protein kinase [Streptomyces gossypii]